jgi:hypothetical protein
MGPTLRLRLRLAALAAALVIGFCGLGCSAKVDAPLQTPTGPVNIQVDANGGQTANAAGFVDLSEGRITEISGLVKIRTRLIDEPFGPYDETPVSFRGTITREETPVTGGETYRVESVIDVANGGAFVREDLWRQDRSGLFLWQEDLTGGGFRAAVAKAIARDPARAGELERALVELERRRAAVLGSSAELPVANARGPRSDEITFLEYPLHPNASWDGRPGFNVWYFDGWESITTPSGVFRAARLHIDVPGQLGPDDFAQTWWATPGETKRHYHFVVETRNEIGELTGFLEADESLLLSLYAPAGVITAQLR